MSQNFSYPTSATVTVSAIGPNGQPIPSTSILIAGEDPTGDLVPVAVAADGAVQVDSSLPPGAATAANQVLEIADLDAINTATAAINTKTPALGQAAMAASSPVVIASNQTAVPISAASLPLPLGAATEVTLAAASAKLPTTLGQKAMAASMAVAIASDQSAISVTPTATPLPTGQALNYGAATAALRTAAQVGNASGVADFNTGSTTAQTMRVVIVDDQPTINVALPSASSFHLVTPTALEANYNAGATGANTLRVSANITRDGTALSYGLGASDANTPRVAANQGFAGVAASVGTGASDTGTQRVVLASNSPSGSPTGRALANAPTISDYSSVNVTSAAYVQLIASTTSTANLIEIFDSSGQTLYLAVGAAASEINQFIIIPGGNGQVPLAIPAGSRVSIKATSTSATSGIITLNLYT